MSKTEITGNLTSARVVSDRLIADITKDMVIIELRGQTLRLNHDDIWNIELIIELANEIRKEAGLE